MDLQPVIAALGTVGGAVGASLAAWWVVRASPREVSRERERLRIEVLGSDAGRSPGDDPQKDATADPFSTDRAVETERFTLLLIDYYAHGLAQAKRNSAASLLSSGLGAGVLLTGVALAILRAETSGQQYAAVVVTLAGVITNAIGVLFHRQANRALTHMEGQTQLLRQDMRSEREAREALELLIGVEDRQLRDRLRAGLILRLADATLPDLTGHTSRRPAAEDTARLEVVRPSATETRTETSGD